MKKRPISFVQLLFTISLIFFFTLFYSGRGIWMTQMAVIYSHDRVLFFLMFYTLIVPFTPMDIRTLITSRSYLPLSRGHLTVTSSFSMCFLLLYIGDHQIVCFVPASISLVSFSSVHLPRVHFTLSTTSRSVIVG